MGTVYRAYDRELDRIVALKLVRPDLTADPETMQRFKQELLLASRVSHKNILRIHDLGDVEGIKFISMAFIQGEDLHSLLKKAGRLSVEAATAIVRQLCEALEAAHREGVVHRDLKPQNVLIDGERNAYISDFGLAKSLEAGAANLTQAGQILGTPRYMSPEQVQGGLLDHRSDLYALGLIFYEMVTGGSPFTSDSIVSLYERVKQTPKNPKLLNPELGDHVIQIILRCLERDPAQRYQSAREILDDLVGPTPSRSTPRVRRRAALPARWVLAAVGAVVLAAGGYFALTKLHFGEGAAPSTPVKPLALAILPFRNASGDPALDWLGPSLAEMLKTEVGQSSQLRTVSSDRMHQILRDLHASSGSDLDPATRKRLAEFTSADRLVWGQYVRMGPTIRMDVTIDNAAGQEPVFVKAEAATERDLLGTVHELARSIEQKLPLSAAAVRELGSKSAVPLSLSVAAIRSYNEGLQLVRIGRHSEALKRFRDATREDGEFALAHFRLAQTYANLGYNREAQEASRDALRLSDKRPDQERLVITANHARLSNDLDKAIEAYQTLAKTPGSDPQVRFELAGLYEAKGTFDLAREQCAKVLEADPKYLEALLAAGRIEIKARNPQASLEYLNRALALAIELNNAEAKANVLNAIGIAYKRLNKPEEALRYYKESLALKRQSGDKRGTAATLSEVAQVEGQVGRKAEALASYEEALKLRREIGDMKGVGNTLIDLGSFYHNRGEYDQALKLYRESLQIQVETGNENYQALCLANIGNIHLFKGKYEDAGNYLERALRLREKLKLSSDVARTLYDLAETANKMGQYDQALTRYMRALDLWRNEGDKRNVAIASYGMATLFQYQGRYGAALEAKEEALKTLRQLGDRGNWFIEILGAHGNALTMVGRYDEAAGELDEALKLARQQQNNPLIAQILNYQGDRLYYAGTPQRARPYYQQAIETARKTTARDLILVSRLNLARLAIRESRSQAAAADLDGARKEAEGLGLKYVALQCSIDRAEALANSNDRARARKELEYALSQAEALGLRPLLARTHYLLGSVLAAAGTQSEADRHAKEALRIVQEMSKEARSAALLEREDLKPPRARS
jgi:tetratricopeptide (TPR) repeat protein